MPTWTQELTRSLIDHERVLREALVPAVHGAAPPNGPMCWPDVGLRAWRWVCGVRVVVRTVRVTSGSAVIVVRRCGRCACLCGAPFEAGKRFCGDCGAAVGGPQAAMRGTCAMGGRCGVGGRCGAGGGAAGVFGVVRRLVGFTPLSESRDPEEVRELLSRYFETARTVIVAMAGWWRSSSVMR